MVRREISPSILEANFFYFFIGLLLLTLGSLVQSREIYTGLVITEYLIIFLPTICYLKIRQYDIKKILRLNKLSLKQAILIPFIVLFFYPTGVFLNYIVITILSAFSKVSANPVPIPQNNMELVISLLVISLSAGICEEIMFRGFIMKSYESLGMKKAIIISGLLFGLFHLSIQNLVGPAFLGVLFGYIVYKTNSIYSSIIAHATNNTIALVLGILVLKLNSISTEPLSETTSMVPDVLPETYILVVGSIFVGIFALAMGAIAFMLLRALPRSDKNTSNDYFEKGCNNNKSTYSIISTIPIILFLIIFLYITYITLTM